MALSTINNNSIADTAVHGVRNLIINGAMQVAQRSTSVTGKTTTAYHTVDRFKQYIQTMGTWSISQSTEAPSGFANSLKMDCTIADASPASGDYVFIEQRFEGQDLQHLKKGTSSAKKLTVSFWVRSSKTGTYTFKIYDLDNTRHISKSWSISTANTWEHKTITLDGDTSGSLGNDNGASLQIQWWLGAGSAWNDGTQDTSWAAYTQGNSLDTNQVNLADSTSNEFYLTGVQLEVGDTATPFEHRSYGDELSRCQRYYEIYTSRSISYAPDNVNGNARMMGTFAVNKRSQPTMTASGGWVANASVNAYEAYHNSSGNNFYPNMTADAEL